MDLRLLILTAGLGLCGSPSANAASKAAEDAAVIPLTDASAQQPGEFLDLSYLEFIMFVTQTTDTTDPIELNPLPLVDTNDDDPNAFYVISSRH